MMYPQLLKYPGILPCWPLLYVMSHYPFVYKYPEIIYKPSQAVDKKILEPKSKRKHHIKKKKYAPGVAETLEFIECFNPDVFKVLTQCGMPYEDAQKVVRKMINALVDYCD